MAMKILFILGIVAVLVFSGLILGGNIAGRVIDTEQVIFKECPDSCEDGNPCTSNYCDISTDYECRNDPAYMIECGDGGTCYNGVCLQE